MGILRLILLLALIYGIFKVVTLVLRRGQVEAAKAPKHLLRCEKCGVWVPQANAISHGDHHYCSETCRQKEQDS